MTTTIAALNSRLDALSRKQAGQAAIPTRTALPCRAYRNTGSPLPNFYGGTPRGAGDNPRHSKANHYHTGMPWIEGSLESVKALYTAGQLVGNVLVYIHATETKPKQMWIRGDVSGINHLFCLTHLEPLYRLDPE